jgi:hypothetical protein
VWKRGALPTGVDPAGDVVRFVRFVNAGAGDMGEKGNVPSVGGAARAFGSPERAAERIAPHLSPGTAGVDHGAVERHAPPGLSGLLGARDNDEEPPQAAG